MITRQDILDMGYEDEPWFGDAIHAVNFNTSMFKEGDPRIKTITENLIKFYADGGTMLIKMYQDMYQVDPNEAGNYGADDDGPLREDDGA